MPAISIVIILIQILLCVHVVKRGHNMYWIVIIILFPLIGGLVYLLMAVLPELQQSHGARSLGRKVRNTLDPHRDLRQHTRNFEMSDTVENKIRLADELFSKGDVDAAIELYQKSLSGIYQHEPILLLGLARAYFHKQDYANTKQILDRLIEHNPEFKSQEGHLLYARSLESLGQSAQADEEYRVLIKYFSGYEAKCRYALFLKSQGRTDEANGIFQDILKDARHASRHATKLNNDWIVIARREAQ